MVTAFALIRVERAKLAEVAERLVEVEGIAEVYSVAGEFDYVAVLRVPRYEDMADVVTGGLARVDGVVDTETLMAFRCYSRHDLDRMWNLGGEAARPEEDPGAGESAGAC